MKMEIKKIKVIFIDLYSQSLSKMLLTRKQNKTAEQSYRNQIKSIYVKTDVKISFEYSLNKNYLKCQTMTSSLSVISFESSI